MYIYRERERDDETQTCTHRHTQISRQRRSPRDREDGWKTEERETGMQTCKRDQQTDRHTRCCTNWDRSMYINTCKYMYMYAHSQHTVAHGPLVLLITLYQYVGVPFHSIMVIVIQQLQDDCVILYRYYVAIVSYYVYTPHMPTWLDPLMVFTSPQTHVQYKHDMYLYVYISLYYSKCNNNCVIC